jgi:signal transduction histidine kinase
MQNFIRTLTEHHERVIYIISAVSSLTFAVVIFTLRRNAIILREKKWAMPFAVTFLLLAGVYLLLFLELELHLVKGSPPQVLMDAVICVCSGLTNFLFLLSAFRLAEPTLNTRRLVSLKQSRLGGLFRWPVILSLLVAAALLQSSILSKLIFPSGSVPTLTDIALRAPDAVFSALALSSIGYVLYASISFRHDEFMAKLAFLSSFCYAVLYLCFGLGVIQALVAWGAGTGFHEAMRPAGLMLSLVSLVLKFGIFLPGYSLMLLVSGPLEGVDRLLENVTRRDKEYLESDGVAMAIRKEMRVNSVRIYIKRPGPDDERVVLCAYPSLPTIDGNGKEPQEVKYKQDSHYDRVLKTGELSIEAPQNRFIRRISEVTVPVYVHNSAIAVLYVERGERNFTEADLINLKRIATMVSPAIQAYRELDALRQIKQDLAQLQIKVKEYEVERDVLNITRKVHEVISPQVTGVSINLGFKEYEAIYPPHGELAGQVKQRLKAKPIEEETEEEGNRWFTMDLKISDARAKSGGQPFGKFIFAPESGQVNNVRTTVGTNPTFRHVLSDLLTDTLLNFIRGRLNRLTDKLGSRLSGLEGTETEDWRKEVEETAREAELLWVVAKDSEKENLLGGSEAALQLVEMLESPGAREQWEMKEESLWLYSLEEPHHETSRVVRKVLKESGTTLWLGVRRRDFGPELDYVSPWKYFLEHFCEIADSALRRIQILRREEKQNKNLLLFYSMVGATVDNGVILHALNKHTRFTIGHLETLREAAGNGGPQISTEVKNAIDALELQLYELRQAIFRLQDVVRRYNNHPCSLNQVIADVSEELKKSLANHDIKLKVHVPPLHSFIDVPYGVARSALNTVVVNALEALQDYPSEGAKEIRINVGPAAGKFNCDVTDNGPGVSDEVKPTILKEQSASAKPGSHGLGLLFSKFALVRWGGDLLYLEQNGKPGASFRIEFPNESASSGGGAK